MVFAEHVPVDFCREPLLVAEMMVDAARARGRARFHVVDGRRFDARLAEARERRLHDLAAPLAGAAVAIFPAYWRHDLELYSRSFGSTQAPSVAEASGGRVRTLATQPRASSARGGFLGR